MGLPQNAVARGIGITTTFRDLSGGAARLLPQRVAIIAQGQSGVSYSTDKFTITNGSVEVGTKLGFSSPAYLAARELFPQFGDGLGTIPCDVIPLAEAPGATAAAGDIVPSGTATEAGTYRVIAGGVQGQPFSIPKGAVDVNLVTDGIIRSIQGTLGMPVTAEHTHGTVTGTPDGNTGDSSVTALPCPAVNSPWAVIRRSSARRPATTRRQSSS